MGCCDGDHKHKMGEKPEDNMKQDHQHDHAHMDEHKDHDHAKKEEHGNHKGGKCC